MDYNRGGEYWLMVRAEPGMAACYHGPAKQLEKAAKDVIAGKKVKVPVKEPASPVSKEDWKRRADEVTDVLKKNRKE